MNELKHLIEQLIKPISEENPTGVDLREDTSINSLYYQAKDARTHARSIERRIQQGDTTDSPNELWQEVYNLSKDILMQHSKDLEVCAWLVEAFIRKHGLSGLTASFSITASLVENYWNTLYPEIDEDDISHKVAPLAGLNGIDRPGSLIVPIGQINITQGQSVGPFALWQYRQAIEIDKIADENKKAERIKQLGCSVDDIKQASIETSSEFYVALKRDITLCQKKFTQLHELLDKECGIDAPPTSFINEALEQLHDHITFILLDSPHTIAIEQDSKNEEHVAEEVSITTSAEIAKGELLTTTLSVSQSISNRNDALQQLNQIANYFNQTEPHSPLPYLIKRAVNWANMSLPELLNELIHDDKVRGDAYKLTGIQNNE